MALKKCYKLHKLFLAELERCQRLDREGAQVLSSLANVAQRVPLLAEHAGAGAASSLQPQPSHNASATATNRLGVLAFVSDTPALLLEKHFLAIEKSATFLRDIVKDLADAVRRLRGFADEFEDLVDEVSRDSVDSGGGSYLSEEEEEEEARRSPLEAALILLEWMENVRTMYERDALRKRLLVANVEYWDVARLQRMHREWPASASASFVDVAYVRMGTEELPPLPAVSTVGEASPDDTSSSSTSTSAAPKKKKKKKKSNSANKTSAE